MVGFVLSLLLVRVGGGDLLGRVFVLQIASLLSVVGVSLLSLMIG